MRDVDDVIQVGETLDDSIVPFARQAFSDGAYGRIVTLAELKIEL